MGFRVWVLGFGVSGLEFGFRILVCRSVRLCALEKRAQGWDVLPYTNSSFIGILVGGTALLRTVRIRGNIPSLGVWVLGTWFGV